MVDEGSIPHDSMDSDDSEQRKLSYKKYQQGCRERQKRNAAQDPKYREALTMQRKSYQLRYKEEKKENAEYDRKFRANVTSLLKRIVQKGQKDRDWANWRTLSDETIHDEPECQYTYADEVSEQLAVHDGFGCVEDAMAAAADWMIEYFDSPLPGCLPGISVKLYPKSRPKGSQCLELDLPWFAEIMGRHPLNVDDATKHAERLTNVALGKDDSARKVLREEAVELIEAAPNMLYCKATFLYVSLFCNPPKLKDIATTLGGDILTRPLYSRKSTALRELIREFGGDYDSDLAMLNNMIRLFAGQVLPERSTAGSRGKQGSTSEDPSIPRTGLRVTRQGSSNTQNAAFSHANSADDLDDATDEEDWAAIGPKALMQGVDAGSSTKR
ncbi:uncharacterized protein BDZ99DRAFT_572607 [Mytilinidion resinicola]|uniref:Uncharacterized protein n=1 Tax=Mytilinidion resinicola TaxID=574789 RepID=A0A6A6YGP3_9PEZI|nr:uncharacterized protein BDZ99DRAFT_572607 [Mytilinidion resinicola]KAF2807703.1 hypothetical protein BDZ99DRAFT_572607 [Mytilinidion resinicola]